jgi:hypothetical protein
VQSCHAAIECAKKFDLEKLPDHPSVIILGIKDEAKLFQVKNYLLSQDIDYCPFHEADLDNQLTALATEPIVGEKRKLFKKFQLLRSKGGVQ